MKRNRIFAAVLLMTALVMAMSSQAFANKSGFDGDCKYNGSRITSSFDSRSLAASIADMEPGDELEYTLTYANGSGETTEWYMRNQVLETLEEEKTPAENGGYTYILKNIGPDGTETVLFDNSEVGGEAKVADLEGLRQATNATGDYFYIQELAPSQKAKTYLYVGFDGETEVNDYMDTHGRLLISYAVEEKGNTPGNTTIKKTGDDSNLRMYIILNALAALLLILAVVLWVRERRNDRKGGEDA